MSWLRRFKDFIVPGKAAENAEGEEKAAEVRTGRNAVRSGSYFAGAGKVRHPLGMSDSKVRMWSLITLAIVIADLLAFGFIAGRLLFGFAEKLCYALKLDGVSYVSHSFRQVEMIIAYAADFLLGGLFIWLTLSIAGAFCDEAFLKLRRKHIFLVCLAFAGLFLVLSLISFISGHGYDSYSAYRFFAPFLCYAGGTAFLGLSMLKFDIH